eukprot:s4633_g4.t1
MGLDPIRRDGLPAGHGVLSYMLAAAAKPVKGNNRRQHFEAQFVGANTGINRAEQFVMVALAARGTGMGPIETHQGTGKSEVPEDNKPLGEPDRNWSQRLFKIHGNTSPANLIQPRSERSPPGGAEKLGRTPGGRSSSSRRLGREPRFMGNPKPRRHHRKTRGHEKRIQGAERDGRDGQPRRKATLDGIAELAASRSWLERAKSKFEMKFFAAGTWTARATKRRKIMELVSACGSSREDMNAETISAVAAALDEAKLQSAEQYLAELKWIRIESGLKWDEVMERRMVLCKRALKRDIGPEKRALEVKIEEIEDEKWFRTTTSPRSPVRTAWSYAWACIWMLRVAEAADVLVGHVRLNWQNKEVKLIIPRSKKDQEAKGVTRTLTCCGQGDCRRDCPWQLAVLATSRASNNAEDPLFGNVNGNKVPKQALVKAWQNHLNPAMSGHSARRSGAMLYTRAGLDVATISFLGRWKSSAVFRYISDALETMPLNSKMNIQEEPRKPFFPSPGTPFRDAMPKGLGNSLVPEPEGPGETHGRGEKAEVVTKIVEVKRQQNQGGQTQKKPLWAVSRSGRTKTRHLVTQASWGLPLDEWSTACGWHFAKYHVKVELTRVRGTGPKDCQKCMSWINTRDKVSGGWQLAQVIQLDD